LLLREIQRRRHPDILWRDNTSGTVAIWFLNGKRQRSIDRESWHRADQQHLEHCPKPVITTPTE